MAILLDPVKRKQIAECDWAEGSSAERKKTPFIGWLGT
jgi:hypothetical protein